MRQYALHNVLDDLLDVARIDGCGEFGIYWRVVVPILKPAMAALGILMLLAVWNNLMWAFIVLRTDDMYTGRSGIHRLLGALCCSLRGKFKPSRPGVCDVQPVHPGIQGHQ